MTKVESLDKNALTLSEAKLLQADYKHKGIIVVEPVVEVPEGTYEGKFQTQEKEGKKELVIRAIEYIATNGKPSAFFTAKTDLTSQENSKSYNGIGVALTEQMQDYLSSSVNLAKEHIFRSRQGRVRTFVQLAEE